MSDKDALVAALIAKPPAPRTLAGDLMEFLKLEEGRKRASVLPYSYDETGGNPQWALPAMLAEPIEGAARSLGKMDRGQVPGVEDVMPPLMAVAGTSAMRAPRAGVMSSLGSKPPIIAYHGSPHKFDASRIGTGEGAQTEGYGLYFAENEAVAKSYRDNLSHKKTEIYDAASTVDARYNIMSPDGKLAYVTDNGLSLDDAQAFIKDFETGHRRAGGSGSWKVVKAKPSAHMYQVGIYADPEKFLDWGVPIKNQGNAASDVFSGLGIGGKWNEGGLTGRDAYRRLSGALAPGNALASHSPMAASEALLKAGIPGIKYLDQGSRGTAGEGSRNYVVFDPKIVEIFKRYGIILGAGGVAASAVGPSDKAMAGEKIKAGKK